MPERKTAKVRTASSGSGPRRVTEADERAARRRALLSTELRGQTHIAHRFEEEYSEKFMYVVGIGWYYWARTHWEEDGENKRTRRALISMLRKMYKEGFENKNIEQDVRGCQSSGSQNGVLEIASVLSGFTEYVHRLDMDPLTLNVLNGVLDLRTLELTPKHEPGDLYTKITNCNFDPEARGQHWEKFLASSLPDLEVRSFVQRYVGYSLLGEVTEHVLPIFIGRGRNGKGVFYKAISDTLDKYAHHAHSSLFISKRNDDNQGATPGLLDLQGKRWVTVSETEEGAHLSTAVMKNLVGGDTITARRLYKNFVSFEPSHSIILVTNHLPKVEGDDPAVWERLRVVPWDVQIPVEKRDLNLSKELRFERDAIFAWIVRGLEMYWKIGLQPPEAVLRRTEEYRADSDYVRSWLMENCIKGPTAGYRPAKVKLSHMVDAWNMGPKMKGNEIDSRTLARELRNRGITVKASTGAEQYVFGYTLKDPSRD